LVRTTDKAYRYLGWKVATLLEEQGIELSATTIPVADHSVELVQAERARTRSAAASYAFVRFCLRTMAVMERALSSRRPLESGQSSRAAQDELVR
jgi:hypothetical protein